MNQPPRQSRILWEARPDPDAARRLARPFVACGWIVLVCSVFFLPIGSSAYDVSRARWRFLGFINLPDADVPAALAALQELRRSAMPSFAEESHAENAENAESAKPDPSTQVAP